MAVLWTVVFLAALTIFSLSLYVLGAVLIFAPLVLQVIGLFGLELALLQIAILNLDEGGLRAFLVNVAYGILSTAVLASLPWTAARLSLL